MPNYDGKVVISTELDNKNFKAGVSKLGNQLGGLKSALWKIGATAAAAFSVKAIVNFSKQAIELGSDIAEVQNVVDTAFGDMAYKAEEFASTAIEQFGMSKLAAKKTASTYMAMARGMGLSADHASDMAIELAGLTGDVASFFNISQELADTKLKSVFTGETESLKDLGIVMTQANLNAFAMANGFGKTIDKMTQAEQVELRYQYVTQQLALAQGDFAKTSDSWANQTRILSENWKEFMSVIGQALITVLTPTLKVINSIVSSLIQMANALNTAITALFGGANKQISQTKASAEGVAAAISGSADSAQDLADATKDAGKAAKGALAGFDELNVLTQDSGSGESEASGAASAAVPALSVTEAEEAESRLTGIFRGIGDAFRRYLVDPILAGLNLFDKPVAAFRALFSNIGLQCREWLKPLSEWFRTDFQTSISEGIWTVQILLAGFMDVLAMVANTLWDAWKPVIDWFVTEGLPLLSDIWSQCCLNLVTAFNAVKRVIMTVWQGVIDPFYQFMSMVLVDILTTFQSLWEKYGKTTFANIRKLIVGLQETFQNLWTNFLQPIFEKIFSVLTELWTDHLQPLVAQIGEFAAKFVNAALTVYNNCILPLINWFINVFGPPISKVINSIIDSVKTAVGTIIDAVKNTLAVMGSILDFITAVFQLDWEKAWNAVKDIFQGIWIGMEGVVKGVVNNIISMINSMLQKVESGINGITGAINSVTGLVGVPEIPNLNIPKIPKLAQGAVIPPNREFLAVLGDQKRGTNIEAPLDTIVEAIRLANAQSGGQEVTIRFTGSMAELVRILKPELDKESNRRGVRLVTGGAY